ncbi:hypothetical protein P153DRAFT_358135 [Dothidotthia symphoricarpi CBS 119687]|uniref:Uncharacterized protein n=1 Tax=Dothidotthia symphoricarpi CBS 119687 TaxID=1392245 RepID=A0A6A6AAT6_9PLEO|nr:uncharacterized protein P153DRAFT_358135 [Dothidotthia symphoricarpi CBS 119687]KAF2127988.1 hypothetical protein P153DRAFT_358135 [Dothidotthia symphoricarpi CBS 119687]
MLSTLAASVRFLYSSRYIACSATWGSHNYAPLVWATTKNIQLSHHMYRSMQVKTESKKVGHLSPTTQLVTVVAQTFTRRNRYVRGLCRLQQIHCFLRKYCIVGMVAQTLLQCRSEFSIVLLVFLGHGITVGEGTTSERKKTAYHTEEREQHDTTDYSLDAWIRGPFDLR